MAKKTSTVEMISADWKDTSGAFEQMESAMKKMGLYVYSVPSYEGSDEYGMIISKVPFASDKHAEAAALGYSMKEYKRYMSGEDV